MDVVSGRLHSNVAQIRSAGRHGVLAHHDRTVVGVPDDACGGPSTAARFASPSGFAGVPAQMKMTPAPGNAPAGVELEPHATENHLLGQASSGPDSTKGA
jgi:hypothetical protein